MAKTNTSEIFKLKTESRGRSRVIGTIRENGNSKNIRGYVVMDERTGVISAYTANRFKKIINPYAYSNVDYDKIKDEVINTECSMDRLMIFNTNLEIIANKGIIILYKITDFELQTLGYCILTPKGEIANVKPDVILNSNIPLINAKIVEKNGKKFISAIKKEFAVATIAEHHKKGRDVPGVDRKKFRIKQHRLKVAKIYYDIIMNPTGKTSNYRPYNTYYVNKLFGSRTGIQVPALQMRIYEVDDGCVVNSYIMIHEELKLLKGILQKYCSDTGKEIDFKYIEKAIRLCDYWYPSGLVYFRRDYRKVSVRKINLCAVHILMMAFMQYAILLNPDIDWESHLRDFIGDCKGYMRRLSNKVGRQLTESDKQRVLSEYSIKDTDHLSPSNEIARAGLYGINTVVEANRLGIIDPKTIEILRDFIWKKYADQYLEKPNSKYYSYRTIPEVTKYNYLGNYRFTDFNEARELGLTVNPSEHGMEYTNKAGKTMKLKDITIGIPNIDKVKSMATFFGDIAAVAQIYKRWKMVENGDQKQLKHIEIILSFMNMANKELLEKCLTTEEIMPYIPRFMRDKMLINRNSDEVTSKNIHPRLLIYYASGFNVYLNSEELNYTKGEASGLIDNRTSFWMNYRTKPWNRDIKSRDLTDSYKNNLLPMLSSNIMYYECEDIVGLLRIL